MLKLLIALTVAVSIPVTARAQSAPPDAGALVVDAGVGSGSAIGSGSAAPAQVLVTPVPNITTDPGAYLSDLQTAKSIGWPLFVLVGSLGLFELLAWAGQQAKQAGGWFAFAAPLANGRVTIVLAGLTATVTSMINAIAAGGSWTAVLLGAVAPAITLFAHPAAADVAKMKAAKAAAST